jgi:magnesium-transporting ATPase (P-type)
MTPQNVYPHLHLPSLFFTDTREEEDDMDGDLHKSVRIQKTCAMILGILISIIWTWYTVFGAITVANLMEVIEIDPSIYIDVFVPTTLCLVIAWIVTHKWYMKVYEPDALRSDETKITSTETSRINALQGASVISCLCILITSVQFLSFYYGPPGTGDLHVVHDGMDTKSPIYTLFLVICMEVIVTSVFFLMHLPYLTDVYFRQFLMDAKISST